MNHVFLGSILLVSLLVSCNNPEEKSDHSLREKPVAPLRQEEATVAWQLVRNGTDERAFLQYLNKYPASPHFDSALIGYFDRIHTESPPPWNCSENCALILVNGSEVVLFDGYLVSHDTLTQAATAFIRSKEVSESTPEYESVQDANPVLPRYSEAVFMVHADTAIPIERVQEIWVHLRNAFSVYRDELSREHHQLSFEELSIQEQRLMSSRFEQRIIPVHHRWMPEPPPIPLPPKLEAPVLECDVD